MIKVNRSDLKVSGTPMEILAELTLVAITLHHDVAEHLGKEFADAMMEDVFFEAIRKEIGKDYEDLTEEDEVNTDLWWD